MSELAFYVYCIAERAAVAELTAGSLPSAIEEDSKLEWLSSDDLAALISEVPLASYSEESLAENLSDPSWTAVRAMRHETIAEYVAKRAAVVPLRFGTIYLERAGIERMLSEKGRELRGILERLRGREEWGVNVFRDQSLHQNCQTENAPDRLKRSAVSFLVRRGQATVRRRPPQWSFRHRPSRQKSRSDLGLMGIP